MKLLTKEIRKRLPKLFTQEKKGEDAVAQVKFFSPWSNWTWYASEFDGEDLFFGVVCGFERKFGYFSLSELEGVMVHGVKAVERDMHWEPRPLKDCK